MMWLYSLVLAAALVVSSPWWLARMLTTERYREGMRERLGRVPRRLRHTVAGFADQRRVVWIHAVSVGEVLAASRLVAELEAALSAGSGGEWKIVVSTTTRTGQALARERFGAERVFYFPLDFAWAARVYMRVLRPAALVLMESELWPRMLHECRRAGVQVVVVNARVSDRSFARGMRLRGIWSHVLRGVALWLAQSEEDARRLVAMGARAENVRAIGNLKYDIRARKESRVAELIKEAAAGRPVIVAGSTVGDRNESDRDWEEVLVIQAWERAARQQLGALLVLAPRHPERFALAESLVMEFRYSKASEWLASPEIAPTATNIGNNVLKGHEKRLEILLLDTVGDLASVYGAADVAFIGGSLVKRGGHNPLEPAQFGVPIVMGPSFENFRGIVSSMQKEHAIRIVQDKDELQSALMTILSDRENARAMGERGRKVFEEQQGATSRAVEAIVAMIHTGARP